MHYKLYKLYNKLYRTIISRPFIHSQLQPFQPQSVHFSPTRPGVWSERADFFCPVRGPEKIFKKDDLSLRFFTTLGPFPNEVMIEAKSAADVL